MADRCRLSLLQLHGDEGPAYCREAARRTGCRVMKAARVRDAAQVQALAPFRPTSTCSTPTRSGHRAAPARASTGSWPACIRRVPPLVLSGGLTPENVGEAIEPVQPVRRGHRQRDRGRAGAQGSRQARGVLPRGGGGRPARRRHERARVERRFGPYGGRYVPETLVPALDELEREWLAAAFRPRLPGRARRSPARLRGASHAALPRTPAVGRDRRRGLAQARGPHPHGLAQDQQRVRPGAARPAHGQAPCDRGDGAGQHGVASATACALLGLDCVVYMGTEDMRRQQPNVQRMRLLGAEVMGVDAGARTLKEAVSAAIRDWVANVATTHYIIGSCVGPAPYPALVRDLQRRIGDEARAQLLERVGGLPDRVIACVGGGSNAIGSFIPFVDDDVELVGVEAGGEGLDTLRHSAPLTTGARGVLHGAMSAVLQDEEGPDPRGALDLGRPRLSRRRARARLAARLGPRALRGRGRRRRPRSVPARGRAGGHPARRSSRRTRWRGCSPTRAPGSPW